MATSYEIGRRAEEIAVSWYRTRDFEIIKKNFIYHKTGVRGRLGEIDLIASKDKNLHFVEVKSRSNTAFGHPLEYIHKKKIKHIISTIHKFLGENKYYSQYFIQFDCVWITDDGTPNVLLNAVPLVEI